MSSISKGVKKGRNLTERFDESNIVLTLIAPAVVLEAAASRQLQSRAEANSSELATATRAEQASSRQAEAA